MVWGAKFEDVILHAAFYKGETFCDAKSAHSIVGQTGLVSSLLDVFVPFESFLLKLLDFALLRPFCTQSVQKSSCIFPMVGGEFGKENAGSGHP